LAVFLAKEGRGVNPQTTHSFQQLVVSFRNGSNLQAILDLRFP
jgi:hypothetical protein